MDNNYRTKLYLIFYFTIDNNDRTKLYLMFYLTMDNNDRRKLYLIFYLTMITMIGQNYILIIYNYFTGNFTLLIGFSRLILRTITSRAQQGMFSGQNWSREPVVK